MVMYVLVEMAAVELLGVQLFLDHQIADVAFEKYANQNHADEWEPEDMEQEAEGTLRIAGDDAYSIQLLGVGAPEQAALIDPARDVPL